MPGQLSHYVGGSTILETFLSKGLCEIIIYVHLFVIILIVDYINETVRGYSALVNRYIF
jgi:hypothetical protein